MCGLDRCPGELLSCVDIETRARSVHPPLSGCEGRTARHAQWRPDASMNPGASPGATGQLPPPRLEGGVRAAATASCGLFFGSLLRLAALLCPLLPAVASGGPLEPVEGSCSGPVHVVWQADDAFYDSMARRGYGSASHNNRAGLDGARCSREAASSRVTDGYRVNYPRDCIASGLYQRIEIPSQERAYLEYDVCFGPNFDFRGGKLPGLVGGAGEGGGDGRTNLQKGRGGTNAGGSCNGFTARPMFGTVQGRDRNSAGTGNSYSYWCEQPYASGGCPTCKWKGATFKAGGCHKIGLQVIMNAPGQRNGVIRYWVDGQMVMEKTDYMFRPAGANFGIDQLWLDTFYGGNTASWAANTASYAEFKNFRILSDPPFCAAQPGGGASTGPTSPTPVD